MRLYSILVYILILNLVLGFVAFSINGIDNPDGTHEDGIFLPNAKDVVTLQTMDEYNKAINDFKIALETISNQPASGALGFAGNVITLVLDGLNVAWTFLCTFFTTLPVLIVNVAGIEIPDAFIAIITGGMVVLTVFTAIQLITGKPFSFLE